MANSHCCLANSTRIGDVVGIQTSGFCNCLVANCTAALFIGECRRFGEGCHVAAKSLDSRAFYHHSRFIPRHASMNAHRTGPSSCFSPSSQAVDTIEERELPRLNSIPKKRSTTTGNPTVRTSRGANLEVICSFADVYNDSRPKCWHPASKRTVD